MTLVAPPGRSAPDLRGLLARVQALIDPIDAAMLYGSHARCTADVGSDVDVLVLVRENTRTVIDGDLTVAAYLPDHLRTLAQRGSLFVLHLRHDGVVLHDPVDLLDDVLAGFVSPSDRGRLVAELATAAGGLVAATSAERARLGAEMQSLGFYLLRSAVYDSCARSGQPEFDSSRALEQLGLTDLAPLFAERRQPYSPNLLNRVLAALPVVLPHSAERHAPGLAATAVAVAADWPLASDLLAGVVAGRSVDYTALSLPPT